MVEKLLVALALFLNSCANFGPLPEGDLVKIRVERYWEFENLKRIEPEPIYQEWFADLEACLEETADFEKIYWYSASYGKSPAGLSLDGVHYRPKDKTAIVLIDADKETVKHEMAHFILRTNETYGHHWIPRFWGCLKAKSSTE